MAESNQTKVDVSEGDVRQVVEAMETLSILNQKYGEPHGENPMGIVFAAHLSASRRRA